MDALQLTWWHLLLVILIHFLCLDLSTVDCFTWHSIDQIRSRPPPARKDVVQPAWQQSSSKWYPYNLWKKRKRKDTTMKGYFGNFTPDFSVSDQPGKLLSKYERLLAKLHRSNTENSILRNDKWKVDDSSDEFRAFNNQQTPDVSPTEMTIPNAGYPYQQQSHFGNIASVQDPFSSMKPAEEPVTEKKKVTGAKDSGFDDGFGTLILDDGFSKSLDGFSDGFVSSKSQPDTSVPVHTGLDDGSWSDSGSWSDDGFGSDGGSWGPVSQESLGLVSVGEGDFSVDTKDCETILTKSCSDNSECSCHGFYTCSKNSCVPIQDSSDSGFPSSLGGGWGETPVMFSKRKDPRKFIQILMLPWKPQK